MAVAIEIEVNDSGQIASYWRIRRAEVDFPPTGGAVIAITLEGWISADTRVAGKAPVPGASRTLNVARDDAAEAEGLTKQVLYQAIMAFPEFASATEI